MAKKMTKLHRFFFIKPKGNTDAGELAERFTSFDNVEEVLLTEGDFGFIVKATVDPVKENNELAKCISEVSSGTCTMATSYYKYRK